MAAKIDSICNGYIWEAPLCSSFFYGREIHGIVSKLMYVQKENKADVACMDDKSIDRNHILKVFFSEDILESGSSRYAKAEFYYRQGKLVYIKISTKYSHWFRRNREYEFPFINNTIPKDVDPKTKKLLETYLNELP